MPNEYIALDPRRHEFKTSKNERNSKITSKNDSAVATKLRIKNYNMVLKLKSGESRL